MSIKEFLLGIRKKEAEIEIMERELERMESMAQYRGSVIDEIGGARGTSDPHSRESLVARMCDLRSELDRSVEEVVRMREKGLEMVKSLKEGNMMRVFYMRYFEHMKWEDIAERLGVSRQWVTELHGRGLVELGKRFGEDVA